MIGGTARVPRVIITWVSAGSLAAAEVRRPGGAQWCVVEIATRFGESGAFVGKDRRVEADDQTMTSPGIGSAEAMEEDAASGVIRPAKRGDHFGDTPLDEPKTDCGHMT